MVAADHRAPLTIGHEYVGVIERSGRACAVCGGRAGLGRGPYHVQPVPQLLAGRHTCAPIPWAWASTGTARSPSICVRLPTYQVCDPRLSSMLYSIPTGNAVHTALSFGVLGEDILITGPGPSVYSRARSSARGRSTSSAWRQSLPAGLARKMGHDRPQRRGPSLPARWPRLHMKEGFGVGLEMSEAARRSRK